MESVLIGCINEGRCYIFLKIVIAFLIIPVLYY